MTEHNTQSAALLVLCIVTIVACEGNVQITVLPTDALKVGADFSGILFYPPQYVQTTHSYTARVNDVGSVVGTVAGNTCEQTVQKQEIAILPDLSTPMLLKNNSGFLSSAKLSASLSNGMLTAVNAEPTQKASEVISASAGLMKELVGVPLTRLGATKPACNAEPRITKFERVTLDQ